MESMDTWEEIVEIKLNMCKTTEQVDGLARTTKAKNKRGMCTGKDEQDEGKSKGKPGKGKGKSKNEGKDKLREWRGTHDLRVRETQDERTQVGHTDNWDDTAQICWMTRHGNKRQDRWCCRNLLKNRTA